MAQINKPNEYFNTKLYSGNSSTQSLTGVNFQPDFTWIKERNASEHHYLFDVVRGVTNFIYTNLTNAEASNANSLTAFDSDGFTLGNYADINESGKTYASWNWLAGGTASSNTDGSITSNVSANTTSGFSIVSYTGTGANATVGHGLGVAPKMVIIKNRTTAAQNWPCYHSALGGTQAIELNNSSAAFTDSTRFNDTDPTSSVFSIGTSTDVNASSASIIAYCFAEKKGFSKIGSYTGNGSTDGPFVYTGFKPAWLLVRRTAGNNWHLYDNKRDSFNVADAVLYPNTGGPEGTDTTADFLSNGFKLRTTVNFANGSGETIIYMAFAENPLVGTNNIPATAR